MATNKSKKENQEQQGFAPAVSTLGVLPTQPVTKRDPVITKLPDGTKRTDY